MRAAGQARPHKEDADLLGPHLVLTLVLPHTTLHSLNDLLSGDGCDLGVSVVKGQLTAWSCASPNTESTLLWHLTFDWFKTLSALQVSLQALTRN
jgi:hypothetical protein